MVWKARTSQKPKQVELFSSNGTAYGPMSVDGVNDGPDQASPDKGGYTYIDPDGTTAGFADGYLDTNSNEQTFTNPAFNNYDNNIAQEPQDFDHVLNREVPV